MEWNADLIYCGMIKISREKALRVKYSLINRIRKGGI